MNWQKRRPEYPGHYIITVNDGYDRWVAPAYWCDEWSIYNGYKRFGSPVMPISNTIDSSFVIAWMEFPTPCEE